MKVRAQVAKPCEKKGDSLLGLSRCECLASCKNANDENKDKEFQNKTSLRFFKVSGRFFNVRLCRVFNIKIDSKLQR